MNKHLQKALSLLARVNWLMLLCMGGLLVLSVLFVESACATREGTLRTLHIQMIKKWIPLGMAAYVLMAAIPYQKLCLFSVLPYLFTLLLLVLVLLIGDVILGARRWLFGFQPSEFAKLTILPMVAYVLSSPLIEKGIYRFLAAAALALFPVALILKQPDLGSAIVIVPATAAMLYVSACAPKAFFRLACVGLIAAFLFLGAIIGPEAIPMSPERKEKVTHVTDKVLFGHWKKRILVFIYPERDPLGAGWNKMQSEIAVGAGGLHGKGRFNGTQNVLGYLPKAVAATDFIFSVIAEETGFMGALGMLLLYLGLFVSIGVTAWQCTDTAGRLLCVGIGTLLFVHVFINVAMTIGRMPITGIPLPLISYGGSFTLSTMAMLGIVQSVSLWTKRTRRQG